MGTFEKCKEAHMILSQDSIQLVADLAELQLHSGDVGTVRKSWHYPTVAYEVEFSAMNETLCSAVVSESVTRGSIDSIGRLIVRSVDSEARAIASIAAV